MFVFGRIRWGGRSFTWPEYSLWKNWWKLTIKTNTFVRDQMVGRLHKFLGNDALCPPWPLILAIFLDLSNRSCSLYVGDDQRTYSDRNILRCPIFEHPRAQWVNSFTPHVGVLWETLPCSFWTGPFVWSPNAALVNPPVTPDYVTFRTFWLILRVWSFPVTFALAPPLKCSKSSRHCCTGPALSRCNRCSCIGPRAMVFG